MCKAKDIREEIYKQSHQGVYIGTYHIEPWQCVQDILIRVFPIYIYICVCIVILCLCGIHLYIKIKFM